VKNKKMLPVRTVSKSKRKIFERGNIDTPFTKIHDR
jgi:hypothetical protein